MAIALSAWGQFPSTDSLKTLLKDNSITPLDQAQLLNELARRTARNSPDQSVQYAQDALKLSRIQNLKPQEGYASIALGTHYLYTSEYEKSIAYALSALRIFNLLDDDHGIVQSNQLLSMLYFQLRKPDQSTEYARQALATALELKDIPGIAAAYNSLATLALDSNRYEEALDLYTKALNTLPKNSKDYHKVDILCSLGSFYYFNGDIEPSEKYLNTALQLAEAIQDKMGEANVRFRLSKIYSAKGDLAKTEQFLNHSQALARQLGARKYLLWIYMGLIELETNKGNNDLSHEYQRKYAALRDSLFSEYKAQQIVELEAIHETEKKEETIRELEQQKVIDDIWRNVFFVAFVFAGAAGWIIFKLQKSRVEKARQLLDVQQFLNDRLKEVDTLKSSFFASISHEFRTPLTLILAPLERELNDERISVRQKKSLKLVQRNAERLLELVNQLLDLSKIEAGKMQLSVRQGRVDQFMKIIIASFDSWAEHRKINFVSSIILSDNDIWFDQDKIEKIATNLLSNAFKFTAAHGTVTLNVSSVKTNGVEALSIIISDTGRGISENEHHDIFMPFYQTAHTIERQEGGTGLGLSLVKELVKLYNGTITLNSKVNAGTTFHIVLPASSEAFTESQRMASQSLENAFVPSHNPLITYDEIDVEGENPSDPAGKQDSVLIVEDNEDLRNFIVSILENEFIIFTADDGEAAAALALENTPSLILSDLMMPKLDGLKLTKRLKNDERTSHIPIILLTAKNELSSRLKGLETGADDYLTKPFSIDELKIRITNLITQRKILAERFRERILISSTPSNEISIDDKFLGKVRSIIEANMSDFSFTVEQLADKINLSRSQLLRKVKALTGISPNEIIRDLRLKRAADLIAQNADTITQIAYSVGFNDQSYFTKSFKKHFNMTPREFSAKNADTKPREK